MVHHDSLHLTGQNHVIMKDMWDFVIISCHSACGGMTVAMHMISPGRVGHTLAKLHVYLDKLHIFLQNS